MPDYLAPTAWYYCDHEENMRGFANWDRPFLFDPARYRELWGNPAAPALTLARIQEALAQHGRSRFGLIVEETPTELLPLFQEQVEALRAELARALRRRSPSAGSPAASSRSGPSCCADVVGRVHGASAFHRYNRRP